MQSIEYYFPKNASIPKNAVKVRLSEGDLVESRVLSGGSEEIVIGAGPFDKMTRRKLIVLFRKVIMQARASKKKILSLNINDFAFANLALSSKDLAELASTNLELANFEFNHYKTKPKEGWNAVEKIYISGIKSPDSQAGFKRGIIIAGEINKARVLANTPGGDMTPEHLAEAAHQAAKGLAIDVTILGKREMERLGMGGVLGVARGSSAEPQFIIMEYKGGDASDRPIVFVGKGITFDSGGLNIKPDTSMYEMHMDMTGGAVCIHAVAALARLGIKKNAIALVPAAENMPSGASYRPGDLLKSMSGKTIEIMHTDAEGRVVLADALTYAERYKPKLVIDVATLTGSAMAALGERASAYFTSDAMIGKRVVEIGEDVGEYMWPLPLWEEFEEEIKGTFGDLANIGKKRWGDAINAAVFLWQFAKKYPWVHIDIAPRITSIPSDNLAKGATGEPLRLLIKMAEEF